MDACQAWGLHPRLWRLESPDDRARMITHQIIKNIREAYVFEKSSSDTKDDQPPNAFVAMKQRMKLKS